MVAAADRSAATDDLSWALRHYSRHASAEADSQECFRRTLSQIMVAFACAHGLPPLEAAACVASLAPDGATPRRRLTVADDDLDWSGPQFSNTTLLGDVYEALLGAMSQGMRKRRGSYFTPAAVARRLVDRVFALQTDERGRRLVLDPAMGAGRFLLEALRYVPASSLHGVDIDPIAVWVARTSVALASKADLGVIREQLRVGDALVDGLPRADVLIGNPPWIAHAGRQSVALEPGLRETYRLRFRAFSGFPTTHGMFIEQAARTLAPSGTLGLLVPTQVSDLQGYAPTREALTVRACIVEPLEELGFGQFDGVTEPTLVLIAQGHPDAAPSPRPWRVHERERPASGGTTARMQRELKRLSDLPRFPAEFFGEAGFQTAGELSKTHLGDWPSADPRFSVPLREGRDVQPFHVRAPRCALHPDPVALERARARLRPQESYARVNVVIRQTARYPIAAVHDPPTAFRNSLLAGYAQDPHALAALLNSAVLRSVHLEAQRDGRQAVFPQLKVAHLRALPSPPSTASLSAVSQLAKQAAAAQAARYTAVDTFATYVGRDVPKTLFNPGGTEIAARSDVLASLVRRRDGRDPTTIATAYEQTLETVRRAWLEYRNLLARIDGETFRLYGIDPDVQAEWTIAQ